MSARLPWIALACFVGGCLLVLVVDEAIARVAGVPLMLAGIALAVAAIATPEFVAGDRDDPERRP